MDERKLRIAKMLNNLELRSLVGEYPEEDFQRDVKAVERFIESIESEVKADERAKHHGCKCADHLQDDLNRQILEETHQ